MTRVLRGITWQNPRGYDPLVAASVQWMAAHPGDQIEWFQQPWYQFEETILASLAAGDGRYDLIMFDHPWTGKLAEEKWLIPWDQLVTPDYLDALRARTIAPSMESYEWGEHLWALPLDAACHSALLRSDLIERSSLPQTWEDLEAWASNQHRPPYRYGLVLSLEGVLGSCLFLSLMAGLGHPAYHDEENPVCDRAAAEYVLTLLKRLIAFTPPGSTQWGPWDIYDHLCANDDVAYCPSIFAYVNYFESVSERGNALRLAKVPAFAGHDSGRAILGGVGLGIAHTCPDPGFAAEYGAFLMSEIIQHGVFPAHHGQPATLSAWTDPAINARVGDFYHDLRANMQHAYIRPRYAAFHQLELANGRALQAWWDDEAMLAETLQRLRSTPKPAKAQS